MSLGDNLNRFLSNLVIRESDWRFDTSAGGTLSVSTPVARLGVTGNGGAIWVKRDSDTASTRLTYGGIGGTVGLSLIPSPANFSFSIPQFPSTGRIYKLPLAGFTLSQNELRGALVVIEVGADWSVGGSGSLMFLGGNAALASMTGPLMLTTLLASSKACVALAGMTITFLPVNAGINIYVGAIF